MAQDRVASKNKQRKTEEKLDNIAKWVDAEVPGGHANPGVPGDAEVPGGRGAEGRGVAGGADSVTGSKGRIQGVVTRSEGRSQGAAVPVNQMKGIQESSASDAGICPHHHDG